jgi:predicted dehydrogenase
MLHFWGYPSAARLADDSAGGPESNAIATFRFEHSGEVIDGTARYSKTTRLPGGLAMDTEAGIVIVRDTDDADIVLRPRSNPEIVQIIRKANLSSERDVFQVQIEDFARACMQGRSPRVTGRQGLESLRLIEALYRQRRPLSDDWYAADTEAMWLNA